MEEIRNNTIEKLKQGLDVINVIERRKIEIIKYFKTNWIYTTKIRNLIIFVTDANCTTNKN